MSIVGPNSQKFKIDSNLTIFLDKCNKYISQLNPFNQYLIWRYTIGSATINKYLIFNGFATNDKKVKSNAIYWTYLFFFYWNKPVKDKTFSPFNQYFLNPESYKSEKYSIAIAIAEQIVQKYIDALQNLILKAPAVTKPFYVYKVANEYPQLPKYNSGKIEPTSVLQLPFNSTTIDQEFDFGIFIPNEAHCCFFQILIPPGSHCLYIPQLFHAYPFEAEILLPHGVTFQLNSVKVIKMNYITPDQLNFRQIQTGPKFVVGPVYQIDQYVPCKNGACPIKQTEFVSFETILITT